MTQSPLEKHYIVRWQLHVDALDARHALNVARDFLKRLGEPGEANLFSVRLPNGNWIELDCTEVDRMAQ